MKRSIILFLIPMAAALVACEGDAAKPGAQAPVADTDLAVPADFATEAETSITPANYKAELDALDKEIGSE
jgi:hypothetical protein